MSQQAASAAAAHARVDTTVVADNTWAMPTINAGVNQYYYTQPSRHGGGPALLLVHGAGGSHLDWPAEIQRLPGRQVYNLDLPGHGRSPGDGRDSLAAYAADIITFVETLGLPQVVVVGHSMGGALA